MKIQSKYSNLIKISIFVFFISFFLSPVLLFANPFTSVHVINEQFEDRVYSVGETVSGNFVLKNTNSNDVPEVYYTIAVITGFNEKTGRARSQFGDTDRQGPIFIAKNSDKTVNFSYKIPQFFNNSQKGEKIVLRIEAYSSSGVSTGWTEKAIKIENTSKQLAEVLNTSIKVGGQKYTLGEGPTVLAGQKAYVLVDLHNISSSSVELIPKITLYDRQPSTPVIGSKTYDTVTIKSKATATQTLELPQLDSFKGVYAGKLRFTDSNDNDVTEGIYLRYIVGDVYGTIQSVVVDKSSVKKGDTFNSSIVYTGPAYNINLSEQIALGQGDIFVDVTNEKGEFVASSTQSISLDTEAQNRRVSLSFKAEKDAEKLFISVIMKRGDQVLANYSTRLTDPDKLPDSKDSNLLYISLGIILLLLILLSTYVIKNKKVGVGMFLVFCLLFMGSVFLPKTADAGVKFLNGSFNAPYNNQTVEIGSTFLAEAKTESGVCSNSVGTEKRTILVSDGQSYTSANEYSGVNGTDYSQHQFETTRTNFNSPTIPGQYTLTLKVEDFVGRESTGLTSMSDGPHYFGTINQPPITVTINVVCPAGTTWDATSSSCVAQENIVNGSCNASVAKAYLSTDTTFASGNFCSSIAQPSPTPIFPSTGGSTTWTCNGTGTGATNAPCTATRGGATQPNDTNSYVYSRELNSNNDLGARISKWFYYGTTHARKYDEQNTAFAVLKTTSDPTFIASTTIKKSMPSRNYTFHSWAGCDSASGNICNVTVVGRTTPFRDLVALYTRDDYGYCGTAILNSSIAFPTSNLCVAGNTVSTTSTNDLSHTWSCSGVGSTVNCSTYRCEMGKKYCTTTNSCIPNTSCCGDCGNSTSDLSCSLPAITPTVTPSFVASPTSMCTLKWGVTSTNSGTGGNSLCTTDIKCYVDNQDKTSLNSSGVSIPVGTHSLVCGSGLTGTTTASVKCRVAPGFGEF